MSPSKDLSPIVARTAPVAPRRRWLTRRGVVGALSALAVVGFAVAIIAPTGVTVTPQAEAAELETTFSLAAAQTQDLTVTVEGASIEPFERGEFEIYVKPKPKPKPKPASTGGGGGGTSAPPRYTGGGSPAEWMTAAGIAQSDWGYVDYIVTRESGWNPNATNSSSGACGLVQAYPCSKVPGSGYNPVDNLRWANGYAVGRYGGWASAYAFWQSHHWW